MHSLAYPNPYDAGYRPFIIKASGFSNQYPITIRGDYAGHPGVIEHAYELTFQTKHFLSFKNITFDGFGFLADTGSLAITSSDPPDSKRSTDIIFDGCTFKNGDGYGFFQLIPGNDRWTFLNNTFMNGANGIYTYLGSPIGDGGADFLTVKNNVFKHLGPADPGDAHAIGCQGGFGHVIEGNSIEDTGAAILFWNTYSGSKPLGTTIIRGNFIKDVHNGNPERGGITIWDTAENGNFIIDHNIVLNTDGNGITVSSRPNKSVQIHNNIIMNSGPVKYGTGLSILNGQVTGAIYNNIIINPALIFIKVDGDKSGLKIDNNLYFSSIGDKKWFGYTSFSAYQNGTGFDLHGINADPLFVLVDPWAPAKTIGLNSPLRIPEDFKFKSTSPAINAGFNWGQINDYFGSPIQGTPDIGPIEFQSMPVITPNIALTKSANKTQASQGEEITYTITYANTGTGGATDVVITDSIPTGTTYVAGSVSNGGTLSGATLTWTIASVASGGSGSVSFRVKTD